MDAVLPARQRIGAVGIVERYCGLAVGAKLLQQVVQLAQTVLEALPVFYVVWIFDKVLVLHRVLGAAKCLTEIVL